MGATALLDANVFVFDELLGRMRTQRGGNGWISAIRLTPWFRDRERLASRIGREAG
jgi:hypothetical protein